MKILIYSKWFSEKMGYAENYLPDALGRLGHSVYLLTSTLQTYATSSDYDHVYRDNLGEKFVASGVFDKGTFVLIRNDFSDFLGVSVVGLRDVLDGIKPDVVYCFEMPEIDVACFAIYKSIYRYKLISESRLHLSIYPRGCNFKHLLMRIVYRLFIQFISKYIDIILPIAQDVEFVLKNYCLISSEKMKKYSLAVNTDIFYCIESKDQRVGFRNHHGYVDDDIVCLYTGRFTDDKCPLLLAKAIHYLQSLGYSKYKGCFVGDGDVKYKECIRSFGACSVFSFADQNKLCLYYNYFDIGVWPAQESTSQLDAAACGMPIVVSSALSDDFRVNGNGLKFASGDYKGLADALLMLYSPVVRSEMGRIGVQKMSNHYSWHHNAELIIEYINALP